MIISFSNVDDYVLLHIYYVRLHQGLCSVRWWTWPILELFQCTRWLRMWCSGGPIITCLISCGIFYRSYLITGQLWRKDWIWHDPKLQSAARCFHQAKNWQGNFLLNTFQVLCWSFYWESLAPFFLPNVNLCHFFLAFFLCHMKCGLNLSTYLSHLVFTFLYLALWICDCAHLMFQIITIIIMYNNNNKIK